MSLSLALGNAVTGLSATARMAEVVSANLANALTDGYGRRSVDLSPASLGGRGAGVRVDGLTRHVDRPLLAERRGAEAQAENRQALARGLSGVEGTLGRAEDGTTLSARLAALEGALVSASADPASESRQSLVLDRLDRVAGTLREAASGVAQARAQADADIAARVGGLNADLSGIEGLNRDIVAALASRRDATGLMDQRQVLVDRVAAVVPVREMDREGGAIALFTPQGAALLDDRAAKVGFDPSPVVTAEMTLASGGLSGLTLNGRPMGPDGVGALGGGALGAAFSLRDGTLPQAGAELDALARDLIARFADPAADPSLGAGAAGLLTDAGAPFDPLDATGLASRIAVNAAVDPGRGGALWRLRDGVGASAPGPSGEGAQIARWLSALSAPRALVAGGRPGGAAALAAGVEAGVAGRRLAAEEEAGFATARWSSLRDAELAGGVDSDQEMQMLLVIEQAYAANARIVEVVESMMRTLMEI